MKLKVYVAGHRGMVGSSILRQLESEREQLEVITAEKSEVNLLDEAAVAGFFERHQPDIVYLAAAKVGGIHANSAYPADFIHENLAIQSNIIKAAYRYEVKTLLFLGSSCIYPKFADQPMAEEALLTGALEATNEPYAIAKIAGIKMCEAYNKQYGCDYRSVMPTNLYGPGDNFHPLNSHVIPALLRRFHESVLSDAAELEIWGTGMPFREFLHVDDMARACVHVMSLTDVEYKNAISGTSHLNVGTGADCTIRELALLIAEIVGFKGEVVFDSSKPDGTPRKLLDIGRLSASGWSPTISLKQGLTDTWNWYVEKVSQDSVRS